MTYHDLATQIRRLPLQQRLELIEVLTRSLKDELELTNSPRSSLERIRGIAKPDGETPTDSEINDGYTDYLVKKYS